MKVSEGYRVAKRLQHLGALGAVSHKILAVRTVINNLPADQRSELAHLVDAFNGETLLPRNCSRLQKQIIRAVISGTELYIQQRETGQAEQKQRSRAG